VQAVINSVDPHVPVKMVHAARGKYIRAEPISALYARGIVYHCGQFEALEDQMCSFTPDFDRAKDGSPDRLDAHVWAMSELFPSLTIMPTNDEDDEVFGRKRTASKVTGY
jgi:phage terminase large subunit-like protein